MIIIVDGPDGVGKTTLIDELKDRLNLPVYKPPSTPLHGKSVNESQHQDEALLEMVETANPDVIFDRWFMSEYAYGLGLERPSFTLAAATRMWKMDKRLALVPDVLPIMITYSDIKNVRLKDDANLSSATLMKINEHFEAYMANSSLNWIHMDSEEDVYEKVERAMLTVAAQRPKAHQVFMEMAKLVATRSTCLSRRTGAVLVTPRGHVIATGYNGVPHGCPHPTQCDRLRSKSYAGGAALDLCGDAHAEENCIAQAALNGASTAGAYMYSVNSPCSRCARLLANARIDKIYYDRQYGDSRPLEEATSYGIQCIKLERTTK